MTALRYVAARAMSTSSLSGASLYRETDANHWTVLWDEADNAFHKNANPELFGVFNAGHDRYFAVVHRQVPSADGEYETRTFDTFTAIALTAINEFPSRAMQSRCIVLVMKRATRADAARLEEFDEGHEIELTECGRKALRWAADIDALPKVNRATTGLINRIWLNWRPPLQIAELAGGTWPARALAAAKADMARVAGEKDDSVEYALLAAIWRVLAADKSTPRRMLTRELLPKLLDEDEGRWHTLGKGGKPIDEYYLRSKLKKLLPTEGEYATKKSRRWRPDKNPKSGSLFGYHELHFADAFERYLGKGLPSATPLSSELTADDPEPATPFHEHDRHTPQTGPLKSPLSDPSDAIAKTANNSDIYARSDGQPNLTQGSDGPPFIRPAGPTGSDETPSNPTLGLDLERVSDPGKYAQTHIVTEVGSDGLDKSALEGTGAARMPRLRSGGPSVSTGRGRSKAA